MTDQLSWSAAGEWLAGFVPEGPARTAVLVIEGLCAALAPFIYKYYLGVLAQGAAPAGSLERQDNDRLRAGLAGGNLAARLYAKWLTAFLDQVERFFSDAGMADRTLFPRAFGLKKAAPLWTAPAFDRCLLLALIYPIATIFTIWAISSHVGPAEAALGLNPNISGWARGLSVAAIGLACFAFWRGVQKDARKSWGWIFFAAAVADAVAMFYYFTGASGGSIAFSVVVAISFFAAAAVIFVGPAAGAVAVALAVVYASALAFIGFRFAAGAGVTVSVLIAGAFIFAAAGAIAFLSIIAVKYRWHGIFLSFFLPAMILACLRAVDLLSGSAAWEMAGPVLLFLGLLTLLNAPFDWASLGLTRALLRRGVELGGWWPYLLALVDAALAAVIIAALALVMVIGVQAFDELAVHGGGKSVLPLDALFAGIAKNPSAPEYWWAYALLLSSMIPSIINLAIGGMAFTRGIPWLARLLLLWMPEGKAVPEYKRQLAAMGLTVQMFAGASLGIAAQGFLALVIIRYAIPLFGLDLLDMARAVADFDLPMRIGQLFARVLPLK